MSEMNQAASVIASSLRAERRTPMLREIATIIAPRRAGPYASSVVARMLRDGRKRQKNDLREQASARAFD
jgi:hypothetical protein